MRWLENEIRWSAGSTRTASEITLREQREQEAEHEAASVRRHPERKQVVLLDAYADDDGREHKECDLDECDAQAVRALRPGL